MVKLRLPSFIDILVKKKERSKIRFINKGYKKLRSKNQLDLIFHLRNVLSETSLHNTGLSKILNNNNFDIELSTRQYLTVRILGLSFNKEVLCSIGKSKSLSHPLPIEWQRALIAEKVKVNHFTCTLLWFSYVFLLWGYGVLKGFKSILYLLKKHPKLSNVAHFYSLSENNIPFNTESVTIINWYLQWVNRSKLVDNICHSVASIKFFQSNGLSFFYSDGLPIIVGVRILYFILIWLYLTLHGFLSIFFRPYSSLMLSEALDLARVQLAKKPELAVDCLFNNSSPIYRPLWTYLAQKKGSRVIFYFYSTNNENFNVGKGEPIQGPWHMISWSYYLVWDNYQASFIKRFDRHNSIVEETGPIWFSSNLEKSPVIIEKFIAVFDVTPNRMSRYLTLGDPIDFYTFGITNKFLNDIYSVLENSNLLMLHKRKRKNQYAHKRYIHNFIKLSKQLNYIEAHLGLNPLYLIKKSEACISMPFTSTALIARSEGKPSIYYDSSGMIQKDDKAAHGIPILSDIEELKEWVNSIKNG
jgi:polysaccharide biosynthesis PFTS motif protein